MMMMMTTITPRHDDSYYPCQPDNRSYRPDHASLPGVQFVAFNPSFALNGPHRSA